MLPHPTHARPRPGTVLRGVAAAGLGLAAMVAGGCAIGQLIGGMAASAQRQGSHQVTAKYTDLTGKDFAVIVAADRAIQGEFPAIVTVITAEMTKRLAEHTGATGVLPATEVLRYQVQHPGWVAKTLDDLAKELGVQRVVYVELTDFSLTDPGNPYIYNGIAAGSVRVIEADASSSEFAYSESVRVTFPDRSGESAEQRPRQEVLSELSRRFIERSAWMFYDHEEPNVIKY